MMTMAAGVHTHATTIEVIEPAPPEVAAGADVVLKVKLSCAAGCDLGGMPLRATTADETVVGREPGTCAGQNETTEITLEAPRRVGEHVWSVVFGPHEVAGVRHDEASLPVRISTIPCATSLAVWAIPSPVVMGERFAIKVGAKSSAGVALTGGVVGVCDESGAVVAHGCLGEAPLPGTSALFWTDIELLAPVTEGTYAWSVTFEPQELELPHEGASTTFSASIVGPPEHRLTIKVIEKDTAAPIADAQVRLGAFRAATNRSGLAEVDMPKGIYALNIWKVGYEAPARTVELDDNVFVEVEVVLLPEENPDAAWLM
jgi:hypothetical protein